MPEPKGGSDEQIMKVAFYVNNTPDLRKVSRQVSLKSLIQDLVDQHSLSGNAEDYCLVYESDKSKEFRIVTDKNRGEMHAANKNIIRIAESPSKSSKRLLHIISSGVEGSELNKALDELNKMSVDPTFALEFFSIKGLSGLMAGISADKFQGDNLKKAMGAVSSLLDQEILSWDEVTANNDFIKKIATFTNPHGGKDAQVIQAALHILNVMVRESHGNENGESIERQLTITSLASLMGKPNPQVQLNALSLINTIVYNAAPTRKAELVKMLTEKTVRSLVLENLIDNKNNTELKAELGRQLFLLQFHILDQISVRMMTKIEPQDSQALQKIKDLRSTAFDTDSPSVKNNTRFAQDYKKLGFTNEKDPTLDFMDTPPGVLALDCMDYFAKNHQEQFTKVVLENSCRSDDHECPFAASSIELVKLLAQILGIGQEPAPGSTRYFEMLFKTEYPFEEFYTVCVILLNKTWREMRATREDFQKVFDVVKEQIEKALIPDRGAEPPKTFDQFRNQVKSYSEISRRWQKNAESREAWKKSEPVKILREHLVQEVEDLIQQQRINFMVEGTKFPRYKRSGDSLKGQFRYVKLHTNHKTLYAGDWNNDKAVPTIEDLEPVLQVSEIKDVLEGSNCPFLKEFTSKGKENFNKLAFSIVGENSSATLDLVAPDEQTYNYWLDGVHTLLRRPMTSNDHDKEKEILLDMEIKLRLLDLEGIDLPPTPPKVPNPPAHFNFSQPTN